MGERQSFFGLRRRAGDQVSILAINDEPCCDRYAELGFTAPPERELAARQPTAVAG